jgi:PAS domain S-box-containing protein
VGSSAILRSDNRSTAERYAVGAFTALAALVLRKALSPVLGEQAPYMTLWPAVVFSAWYCGVGPAIVTVFVGIAGVWLWFFHFFPSFTLQHPKEQIAAMASFVVFSCLIIAMGNATRRGRSRERKLLAETFAATAKFRAVFDQTTVFAGVLTLDGIVIEANRISLEMCGYRSEDVLGRPFWECGWFHGSNELQATVREAVKQAAQGKPFREIIHYFWADESEHICDFAIHPIRDSQGKIIFLHPAGTDITELKQTEENYRTLAASLEMQVRERTSELQQRNIEVLTQSQLLQSLSQRLMEIQDEERRKLARELHDGAGQILAALGMNMQTMVVDAQTIAPQLARDAEENFALIQELSQEIRTMSYLLHPPLLDEVGLSAALNWYIKGLVDRGGLEISLSIPENFARFPAELELVLFRLVQECLTNVYRHSGSKTAFVSISVESSRVHLEIRDQGRGISPDKMTGIETQGSGVGMQGMRERVRHLDGDMQIRSNDSGTSVKFTFPVAERQLRVESAKA